jgi:hypothetical protein
MLPLDTNSHRLLTFDLGRYANIPTEAGIYRFSPRNHKAYIALTLAKDQFHLLTEILPFVLVVSE